MGGYVYLIEDENNKTYKIGVTRNNDGVRKKALQTGNSSQLNILYIIYAPYPFRTESMLHAYYKQAKVLNEWYDLSGKLIENFPKIVQQTIDNIEVLKSNPFFMKKPLK